MSIPELGPGKSVRPFFRALAWIFVACYVVGALGALWFTFLESTSLRERVAVVVMTVVMGFAAWVFLLIALGREAKSPPQQRMRVVLAILLTAGLAGMAWEFFAEPQSMRERIWLVVISVISIASLYSVLTDRSPLRSSP
jgi:hypothetical protein